MQIEAHKDNYDCVLSVDNSCGIKTAWAYIFKDKKMVAHLTLKPDLKYTKEDAERFLNKYIERNKESR